MVLTLATGKGGGGGEKGGGGRRGGEGGSIEGSGKYVNRKERESLGREMRKIDFGCSLGFLRENWGRETLSFNEGQLRVALSLGLPVSLFKSVPRSLSRSCLPLSFGLFLSSVSLLVLSVVFSFFAEYYRGSLFPSCQDS